MGASTAQQYLKAELLDELDIQIAPVLLGDGIRLFDGIDTAHIELERTKVIEFAEVTHLRFRIVNRV